MSMNVRILDMRVGGSFLFDLEDGSSITGIYQRIVPYEKLVFTWMGGTWRDWDTLVTLDFLERGTDTEIVLTHERLSLPEQRTLAQNGWSSMLTSLNSLLSSDLGF